MNNHYELPVIDFSHTRKQATPEGEKYDISLGISEATFNNILKSVHGGVYPVFFNDSIYLEKVKIAIAWNMENAPKVTLRQSSQAYESFIRVYGSSKTINESLMGVLVGSFRPGAPEGEFSNPSEDNKEERPLMDIDASQQILVEINIDKVKLTMENKAKGRSKEAKASIRLDCVVQLNDKNEICVEPYSVFIKFEKATLTEVFGADLVETDANNLVTLPGAGRSYKYTYDEFFGFLINNILIPALIKKITPLIPRFKIPDFQFMGLTIADLDVRLDNGYLVANANIKKVVKSEAPETVNPPGLMDPEGGIFVALSQKFLQTAVGAAIKQYGKIQNQGSASIIDYTYAIEISDPEIGLKNKLINLAFSAKGDASVTVDLWLFSLVFAGHASTLGKPGATGQLNINEKNNDVLFKIEKLNALYFNIDVVCALPAFIASRVISLLISVIVAGVEAGLIGKELKIFTIPTVTFPFEGFEIKVQLQKSDLKLLEGSLKYTGDLSIKVDVAGYYISIGGELKPGQSLRSRNKQYSLIYQEDGDLVLHRGTFDRRNILWNSGTIADREKGMTPGRCYLTKDSQGEGYGNFIIYNKDSAGNDVIAFQTFTNDRDYQKGGWNLYVTDDGTIQIKKWNSETIWRVPGEREGNCLRSKEQALLPSETLFSDNHEYALTYQYDGLLVLKETASGKVIWNNGTKVDTSRFRPYKACLHRDGNFGIWQKVKGTNQDSNYFFSNTGNNANPPKLLFVSDDGYFAISQDEDRKNIIWRRP